MLVVAYAFRGTLLAPWIVGLAERQAGAALGTELEIESLGGSWFGSLELRGVRTQGAGTATVVRGVSVERVYVAYSIVGLIRGGLDGLHEVAVEGLTLDLDLRQGASEAAEDDAGAAFELPASLPSVVVRDAVLRVSGEDLLVELEDLDLSIAGEPDGEATLELRCAQSRLAVAEDGWSDLPLELDARYASGVLRDLRFGDGAEDWIDGGRVDLARIGDGAIEARLGGNVASGRYSLEASLDAGAVVALVHAEDVDLRPAAERYELPGEAAVDLDAEARFALDAPLDGTASVDLRARALRFREARADALTVQLALADRVARVTTLALDADTTQVEASEWTVLLDEDLDPAALLDRARGSFSMTLDQPARWLRALGLEEGVDEALLPALVELRADVEGRSVNVERLIATGPSYTASTEGASFSLGVNGLAGSRLRLPLRLDLSRPWDLPGLDALPPTELEVALDLALLGEAEEGAPPPLELTLEQLVLRAEGEQFRLAQPAKLAWTAEGRLRIDELALRSPAGRLSLSGDLPLAPSESPPLAAGAAALELRLAELDLERLATLVGRGPHFPFASGAGELTLRLEGSWEAASIVSEGEFSSLVFAPELELDAPEVEELRWRAVHADDAAVLEFFTARASALSVQAEGEIALPLDLPALAAGEDFAAGEGGLRATASIVANDLSQLAPLLPEEQSLAGAAELAIGVEGALSAAALRATLRARELSWSDGEQPAVHADTFDLDAHTASWSPSDSRWPLGELRLEGNGLRQEGGPPLTLAGAFTPEPDGVVLDLDLRGPGVALDVDGKLPLSPTADDALLHDPLALSLALTSEQLQDAAALLRPFGIEELPAGAIRAHATVAGTWEAPRLEASIDAPALVLPESYATARQLDRKIALQARMQFEDSRLSLDTLEVRSTQGTIDAQGGWEVPLDLRALAAGETPALGEFDAAVTLAIADLSVLAELGGIRRAGGRLDARLALAGTPDAPRYEGSFELADAELRLESTGIATLDRMSARGSFDLDALVLEELRGDLGAAPFTATGTIALSGEEPVLDLQLEGRDLLLYRQSGVKVRSDTKLAVSGPLSDLLAAGEVTITDGRFVKNIDFLGMPLQRRTTPTGEQGIQLFSLAPPLDRMRFDVTLRSSRGFRLRNNVVDGMARPELRLTGTGEVPELIGEIYLDQIDVSLPANRLRVESGVVRFLEGDPFLPRVDLFASLRRYGYDVQINVNGTMTEPVVTLSSTPPLSQDELLLLVTAGTPPEERIQGQQALGAVAIYLARDLLTTLFGDESTESDESILERIEVETGRDATRSGKETIEGRVLLLRGVLAEGDALYVAGERDSWGDFNLGMKMVFRFR